MERDHNDIKANTLGTSLLSSPLSTPSHLWHLADLLIGRRYMPATSVITCIDLLAMGMCLFVSVSVCVMVWNLSITLTSCILLFILFLSFTSWCWNYNVVCRCSFTDKHFCSLKVCLVLHLPIHPFFGCVFFWSAWKQGIDIMIAVYDGLYCIS